MNDERGHGHHRTFEYVLGTIAGCLGIWVLVRFILEPLSRKEVPYVRKTKELNDWYRAHGHKFKCLRESEPQGKNSPKPFAGADPRSR